MADRERGRPTLFTKQLADDLVMAVAKGNYIAQAAVLCGIDRTTVFRWIKRGKQESEGEYYDFCIAIKKAEAKVEEMCISGVLRSGEAKDLQWYLERKSPERWGRDTFQIKQLQAEFEKMKALFHATQTVPAVQQEVGEEEAKPVSDDDQIIAPA